MKKEIIDFILKNNLSPFSLNKTILKGNEDSIYKTKDAKLVHNKVLSILSRNFTFKDTSNLFDFFEFTTDFHLISQRQTYTKDLIGLENDFLSTIKRPKNFWKPKYGVLVVTEDEKTYNELQKLNCPIKFLITESDLDSLDDFDIVQVIDCENFSRSLERLPQAVFLDDLDDVYLERYLEILSGWKENLEILKENKTNEDISQIVNELSELLPLLSDGVTSKIKRDDVESALLKINQTISSEIKNITFSGESLFTMLSKSTLPEELLNIVRKTISSSGLSNNLFTRGIPVEIDEEELSNLLKKQDTMQHTSLSEKIKKKSQELRKVPKNISELSNLLLLYDFNAGLSKFASSTESYPLHSENILIENSSNIFLENAQAISFHLNKENKCSILTGANSGGKTTLIEHIIQLITLFQLGLSVKGKISLPLFSDIYYFAKNKGSANKGAFETLLTQMSKIKPGDKTLVLADEIESVTEPGVAGAIISATAGYFINQGCYLIIATHLGKEIQKTLPTFARIDGIEAKGLDANFELIVDHNPVLGRLANSTPELIIEKMASSEKNDYFTYLHEFVKKGKV